MLFEKTTRKTMTLGNIAFLLRSCILNNLHVLSNIMLPVCAHTHFAPYIVSCMKKKEDLSIVEKKKKQVIYCSLPIVHRLIISMEEEANAVGATGSLPVTEAESS